MWLAQERPPRFRFAVAVHQRRSVVHRLRRRHRFAVYPGWANRAVVEPDRPKVPHYSRQLSKVIECQAIDRLLEDSVLIAVCSDQQPMSMVAEHLAAETR